MVIGIILFVIAVIGCAIFIGVASSEKAALCKQIEELKQHNKQLQRKLSQTTQLLGETNTLAESLHNQIRTLTAQTENPEQYAALQAILRGENVFIHGKAGTGKSYFIKHKLKPALTQVAYLAPTNIAAINIGGQTIHRFLSANVDTIFQPLSQWDIFKRQEVQQNLENINTLVIDEISMVNSRLFDAFDQRLREIKEKDVPFGGLQVILIGDLFQLPPVEKDPDLKPTRFVFCSKAYKQLNFHFFELNKIYRQQDSSFSTALNILRSKEGNLSNAVDFINKESAPTCLANAPCLYPTRKAVEERNRAELAKLQPSKPFIFKAEYFPSYRWKNNDNDTNQPAPEILELKPKAPIIFLANDPGNKFVNSDVGIIHSIENGIIKIFNVRTRSFVYPSPYTWYQFHVNRFGEQEEDREVYFRQYPLQLAYAITIHKAQGLTLEKASINLGKRTFEAGQAYVALSRVKTLSGLYLEQPIKPGDIKISPEVVSFFKEKNTLL